MQTKKLIALPAVAAIVALTGCETSAHIADFKESAESTLADTSAASSATNTTQHGKARLLRTGDNSTVDVGEERGKKPVLPDLNIPLHTNSLPPMQVIHKTSLNRKKALGRIEQFVKDRFGTTSTVDEMKPKRGYGKTDRNNVKTHADLALEELTPKVEKAVDDYLLHGLKVGYMQAAVGQEFTTAIAWKMHMVINKRYKEWIEKYAEKISMADEKLRSQVSRSDIRKAVEDMSSELQPEDKECLSSLLDRLFAMHDMRMKFEEIVLSIVPPSEVRARMKSANGGVLDEALERSIKLWLEAFEKTNDMIGYSLLKGDHTSKILEDVTPVARPFLAEENQRFSEYVDWNIEQYREMRIKFNELSLSDMSKQAVIDEIKLMGPPSSPMKKTERLSEFVDKWSEENKMLQERINWLIPKKAPPSNLYDVLKKRISQKLSPEFVSSYIDQWLAKYNGIRKVFDELYQSDRLPNKSDIIEKMTPMNRIMTHETLEAHIGIWLEKYEDTNDMIDDLLLKGEVRWTILGKVKAINPQFSDEGMQSFSKYIDRRCAEYDTIRMKFDDLRLGQASEDEIRATITSMGQNAIDSRTPECLLKFVNQWLKEFVALDKSIDELLLRNSPLPALEIWKTVRPKTRQFSDEENARFTQYVDEWSVKYKAMKDDFDKLVKDGLSEQEIRTKTKGGQKLSSIEVKRIDRCISKWWEAQKSQ